MAVAAAVCANLRNTGVPVSGVIPDPTHVFNWYATEARGVPVHAELCGQGRNAGRQNTMQRVVTQGVSVYRVEVDLGELVGARDLTARDAVRQLRVRVR